MKGLLKKAAALVVLMALVAVVTAPNVTATVAASTSVVAAASTGTSVAAQTGGAEAGWACALCLVGAGVVIAGGPAAIAEFLAAGGADLVIMCAVACGVA